MIPFQIGENTVMIDVGRTKTFYERQPKFTEQCNCDACQHYEQKVIVQDLGVYGLLRKMGVDPARVDTTLTETIWHSGECVNFSNSYLVYYKVFGRLMDFLPMDTALQSHPSIELCDIEPLGCSAYSLFQLDGDTLEFRIELYSDPK